MIAPVNVVRCVIVVHRSLTKVNEKKKKNNKKTRHVSKVHKMPPLRGMTLGQRYHTLKGLVCEGESISNQPNLFPVGIHIFFFDVIAL